MSSDIPGVPEEVTDFVVAFWDTDIRLNDRGELAQEQMQHCGIEDDVRRFLLDVIFRNRVTPEQWQDLCNVQTWTPQMVREDAVEFWEWLYGEPPSHLELDTPVGSGLSGAKAALGLPPRPPIMRWSRLMLELRRARAFLPDSAKEYATRDPASPDSIVSLASYEESMEHYEFEMALYSLVGIAKAVGAGPKFWEIAEGIARLMHLENEWKKWEFPPAQGSTRD
jgi:hypothetical protein